MRWSLVSPFHSLSVSVLLLALGGCDFAPRSQTQAPSDPELVRLIAEHGDAVTSTLENLPEIEKRLLAGAPSPLQAAEAHLAQATPEERDAYRARLERILTARAFLLKECRGLPNGVYQAAAEVKELKRIADAALARAGMDTKGMSTYEVMSQMTSGQDEAMLTALASTVAEQDDDARKELKSIVRKLIAENGGKQ